MNKPSNFTNFVDILTEELIAMPDEQVLEGQDANALHAEGQALVNAARAVAGQRRLASAKSGLASQKTHAPSVTAASAPVSVEEARRFIAQAQNDPRYTLAARKLGEMPDEEVLRLYLQMKLLEQPDGNRNA